MDKTGLRQTDEQALATPSAPHPKAEFETRRPLIAVGIDVGELRGKGLDLVALDTGGRFLGHYAHLDLDQLRRLVIDELKPAVVCIDAPLRWAPAPGRARACEVEARRLGLQLFVTPPEERAVAFHAWMRDGMAAYQVLADTYRYYTGGPAVGGLLEVFPHASTVALLGYIPPRAGRHAVRRQVLEAHGLPTAPLRSCDAVDATLAALTGIFALRDQHSILGDAEDTLVLPRRPLPPRFERRDA